MIMNEITTMNGRSVVVVVVSVQHRASARCVIFSASVVFVGDCCCQFYMADADIQMAELQETLDRCGLQFEPYRRRNALETKS